MIIYKTTNLLNGKLYIGLSINNRSRYYGSGILIKLAIKKYGKENFKKEIIEYCTDIDDLNNAEIFWIWKCDSLAPKGYNIAKGGNAPMFGRNHSKAIKEKMSKDKKEYYLTHDPWNKGIPRSDETKQKISEVKKKNNLNKFNIDRDELYQLYIIEKRSFRFLCKKYHCEYYRIKDYLLKYNLYRKSKNAKIKINKNDLYQLYIIEHKTQIEIAQIYKCSRKSIYNYLKEFNI